LPEQIVIGSGISYSIHLLSRLFEESPTIAFEEGGIAQVREIFDQNGFQIMDFPMHGNELFVNKMEEKNVHAIYMTPSHRPSGNPLPYSLRLQTLRWAYTNHAYIIEDDYDGEFRYSGKTIPSLQGLDQKGVVIYIGTFSKAFTPALRMNYMVLPIHLMKKLLSMEHLLSCPSRIDQLAMKLFIERGYWYRQIRRMRNIYRKKHYKLVQLIQMYLSTYVQIASDSAGLHIELIVKTECSAEKLVELALTEGVRVYSSQDKEMNRSTINPKIYLGFGGISMKDMESGVQLLRKAWASVHVAEKSEAN
jgi:GntR family transcriptional regulator/MocR family aminotransferase